MTTIKGQELQEYLDDLATHISNHNPDAIFIPDMHGWMRKIIEAEKAFLSSHYKKNGLDPQMHISLQGLPSTETLKADLETMCDLEEFKEVSEAYKRGTEAQEYAEVSYKPATKQDLEKEFNKQDPKKLMCRTGLKISQTEKDEIFQLDIREEIFKKGYDEYSRKYPLMIAEGSMKYRVTWGDRLVSQHTESYYLPEQKTESMITRPSGQELANTDPKKMKRIAQLDRKIDEIQSTIAHYERNELNYNTSLWHELYVSQFVLELEKTHTAYFRWRENLNYPYGYHIYKKQFLDREIAMISYYDGGWLDLYDQQYLEVFQKSLPELKKTYPNFKIQIP